MSAEMTYTNFAKHTQFDPAKTVQGSSFRTCLQYKHRINKGKQSADIDIEDQIEEAHDQIVAVMRDWGGGVILRSGLAPGSVQKK